MIMKFATAFVIGGVLGLAYALIAWLFSTGLMIVPICLIMIVIGFVLSFLNEAGKGLPTVNTRSGKTYPKSKRRAPKRG